MYSRRSNKHIKRVRIKVTKQHRIINEQVLEYLEKNAPLLAKSFRRLDDERRTIASYGIQRYFRYAQKLGLNDPTGSGAILEIITDAQQKISFALENEREKQATDYKVGNERFSNVWERIFAEVK